MNTDERGCFDDAMTERVLGAIFEVSNTLGAGFLEKVYQR
ncbi:MAG: GxxExxY protein, partial [Acidobacteria bacterium]|nr:GxxExxY protein [Acidobacteriota bacterium]